MVYQNITNSFLKDHCRKTTIDEILNRFNNTYYMKAFVRAVSEDICNKLNELGFEDCYTKYIHTQEVKTMTFAYDGKWTLSGFPPCKKDEFIDCGTDIELFFNIIQNK